jgi:hypothetical protein
LTLIGEVKDDGSCSEGGVFNEKIKEYVCSQ